MGVRMYRCIASLPFLLRFYAFFFDPGGLLHPKKIFVRSILVTFVRSLRIICIAMSMAALEKASAGV